MKAILETQHPYIMNQSKAIQKLRKSIKKLSYVPITQLVKDSSPTHNSWVSKESQPNQAKDDLTPSQENIKQLTSLETLVSQRQSQDTHDRLPDLLISEKALRFDF